MTSGRRLGRDVSFSVLVFATVLLMAPMSAPSPIYPLHLQRWGFSVTILTVVFAVYVAGLVGALLTVGSLSDHLGRRAALLASLLVAATGRCPWAQRSKRAEKPYERTPTCKPSPCEIETPVSVGSP